MATVPFHRGVPGSAVTRSQHSLEGGGLRWQREQEAEKKRKEEAKKKRRSRKSSAGEKTNVEEEEEEVDQGPPPPTKVEQIYEGQKPLWKTKQMLCIKIGYAEEKNCLAISCKDAEENLFPPVFLDASKILQAERVGI